MALDNAVEALQTQKSVDGAALGKFLDAVTARLEAENSMKKYREEPDSVSMKFCRVFCEVLLRAGDPEVVARFLKSYCARRGDVMDNETLVPFLAKVVSVFDWGDIGEAIMQSLGCGGTESAEGCSAIAMTLRVAGSLDAGVAQKALLKMATGKAMEMKESELFLAKYIGLLWECVIRCGNSETFGAFAKKLEGADPALLGPSIQYLSQYLSGVDEKDDKVALLASVCSKQIKWLKAQIEAMDKKFSWEMAGAEFGESDRIQAFLRGPEITTTTHGMKKKYDELRNARADAANLTFGQQVNCSFEAKATEINGDVFVTITKTRQWFLEQQKKLVQYKEELRELTGDTDAKRARLN